MGFTLQENPQYVKDYYIMLTPFIDDKKVTCVEGSLFFDNTTSN